MSLFPRLYDIFPTSPLADPIYKFDGAWTYNATFDRIEADLTTRNKTVEILNSSNNYGIFEIDIVPEILSSLAASNKAYVRAFGYTVAFFRAATYIFQEENEDWHGSALGGAPRWHSGANVNLPLYRPQVETLLQDFFSIRVVVKFVSTPFGVSIYFDGVLKYTGPAKPKVLPIKVGFIANGQDNTDGYIYSFDLKGDSSLPKSPVILDPSESGSINAAQTVAVTVPESRLFLDLGSYAPGITGLTNVFYDPSGANVAMAQDTGIPTRSGGTTGDYYLEIPSNGVAYDYRLVFKEAFVIANTVVVTDDVDFDVTGGPAAQNALVKEDDDLHCYIRSFTNQGSPLGEISLNTLGVIPQPHNFNADGNLPNVTGGSAGNMVLLNWASETAWNASVSFPIILDYDLGRIYDIKRINLPAYFPNGPSVTGCDIYSNTIPFVGASLAQGTLEATLYPTQDYAVDTNSSMPSILPQNAALPISTRYLRFVILNSGYFNIGLASQNYFTYGIDIKVNDIDSINSDDDNAQFEFDSGGGFGAFPVGGVSQGSGNVRITLTSPLQVAAGDRKFIAVQFKADLTD